MASPVKPGQDDRLRLMTDEERNNYNQLQKKGFNNTDSVSMATNPSGRLDAPSPDKSPPTRYDHPNSQATRKSAGYK